MGLLSPPDTDWELLKKEWSEAVGNAILGFGNIEFLTYGYIKEFSSDNIFNTASTLNFSRRVDLILEILKSKDLPDDLYHQVNDVFDKAKSLAETRNVLAHNPLMVGVYEDQEGNISLRQEVSHYRKKHKVFSLVDVRAFGNDIDEVNSALIKLIGELTKAGL